MMRIYRAILHLYPKSFRGEYGEEMCVIFARRRRDATGPFAVVALWAETCADVVFNATAVHWDILRQDVRYTARTLRRAWGFALTSIAIVALGVGANTAVFSVTDFVLLRPLPFPQPERLVKLWEGPGGSCCNDVAPANYRDWKRRSTSFEAMAAFTMLSVNLSGQGDPQRLEGATVTADLLPTLGVQPALGRLFSAADDRAGAAGTVLLSYRFWQSAYGGDAGVLGRSVRLDDEPYVVIGVMPPDFRFPTRSADVWTPARFAEEDFQDRNNNYQQVVGRLKPGVSLAQARAEMDVVGAQLTRQYPKELEDTGVEVIGLRDELGRQSRLLLLALSGAALCVLLIACANLANLLLARALGRRQELAVRTAMGAGRERLVRQLATESLTIVILGGALGVCVAVAAVPLLARLVPAALPTVQTPSVDMRVLIFAGVLTALTGIAFGLLPVLRSGSDANLGGLREGLRAGGGQKERLRSALVIAEVIASVVLLVTSGLLLRALWTVQGTDPGFRTDGVVTLRTHLPWPKYETTAKRERFYTNVLENVRTLPGVSSAAYVTSLPMVARGMIQLVGFNNVPPQRGGGPTASLRFVTPGYFTAMSIPVHAGRDVSEADTRDAESVAVVSQSFVRRHWPDGKPLGRHFQFASNDHVVVGVVGDIRVRGLERPSEPQVYLPYKQVPDASLIGYTPKDLVVKASTPPESLIPAIRSIIRQTDPQQAISDVRPLAEIVGMETASRSVQVRVLGTFAAVAFLLAAVGIHGLLSFAVSQRTPEFGVRIALGAQRGDIVSMVLRQGALLAAAGVIPGIALAYAAGRAMEALLAGVKPADAITFLAATGLCIAMTLGGSLLPALRALRIDPVRAIRAE